MITVTADAEGLHFNVRVKGVAAYLDNWAIINLAKGSACRRWRFLNALRRSGSLLFSFTNALELAGPQGVSARSVQRFLRVLGAHWVPVELNPWTVIDREAAEATSQTPVLSEAFMQAYTIEISQRISEATRPERYPTARFTRLHEVMNWVQAGRAQLLANAANIDATIIDGVKDRHARYEADPGYLDSHLPLVPFDPKRPATFVTPRLLRQCILDGKSHPLKKGDGPDFCHAAIGTAFGSFVALDKHWKRRVTASIPSSHDLARVYSPTELDRLVDDLETHALRQPYSGSLWKRIGTFAWRIASRIRRLLLR